jgi:hypothetical protein
LSYRFLYTENGRLINHAKDNEGVLSEEATAIVDWLGGLANWETFFTGSVAPNYFTRRDGVRDFSMISCRSLQKAYEGFMRKHFKGISYVVAYEPFGDGHGFHCHALLSDAYGMRYKNGTMWTKWFERFGRNSTEGIEHAADVRAYVTKYIIKEWAERKPMFPDSQWDKGIRQDKEIWWNVKVKGQREFSNVTS